MYFKVFHHGILQMQPLVILCRNPNATIHAKNSQKIHHLSQNQKGNLKNTVVLIWKSAKVKNIRKWIFKKQTIKPITPWSMFIACNIYCHAKRSEELEFWRSELRVWVPKLCVGSVRGALEEDVVHIGRAAHWAQIHRVNLHCRGASRRRGALGLCTAHRADRPTLYHLYHQNAKTRHFFGSKWRFVDTLSRLHEGGWNEFEKGIFSFWWDW